MKSNLDAWISFAFYIEFTHFIACHRIQRKEHQEGKFVKVEEHNCLKFSLDPPGPLIPRVNILRRGVQLATLAFVFHRHIIQYIHISYHRTDLPTNLQDIFWMLKLFGILQKFLGNCIWPILIKMVLENTTKKKLGQISRSHEDVSGWCQLVDSKQDVHEGGQEYQTSE